MNSPHAWVWAVLIYSHPGLLISYTILKASCKILISRLQQMRRPIACARLYTCLKHQRHAKKSMPFLIQKASRCAADHTAKTTMLFIFHFLYNTKILRENHVYLFFISLVQCWKLYYIFIFFTERTTDFERIKKKHEWWNNRFSDVFTYRLNLKNSASLFFLIQDNFMF